MSQANQPAAPSEHPRSWKIKCVTTISAATVATYWLADLNSPTSLERWQWVLSAAIVSGLLSGAAIGLGRRSLTRSFGSPLRGLFVGLTAGAVGGCINAAIEFSLTNG